MRVRVLMITHNRPEYTRMSLGRLCETLPADARVTVWDNASSGATLDVLKGFEGHPAVESIVYNSANDRLLKPTNWFWENTADAELVSKVDDDCLMPAGWVEKLSEAHSEIPEAGLIGCWRFLPEDFDMEKAARKIHAYGAHTLLRNCWLEGSGYLMKRRVIDEVGLLKPADSFTSWCIRAAARGYMIGWYYPFLYQEHMDDPRAEHTGIRTDEDLRSALPLSAARYGVSTRQEWVDRLRQTAQRVQEYSIDPYDFIGFKSLIKRRICRALGRAYLPRA